MYEPLDGVAIHPCNHKPQRIIFHHPGDKDVPFLALRAFDMLTDTVIYGLHYGTAITACSIFACTCNKTGYLTEGTPDGNRVDADWDAILQLPKYYFHTENDDRTYPICPCFNDWEFPGALPSQWVCRTNSINVLLHASDFVCTWTIRRILLQIWFLHVYRRPTCRRWSWLEIRGSVLYRGQITRFKTRISSPSQSRIGITGTHAPVQSLGRRTAQSRSYERCVERNHSSLGSSLGLGGTDLHIHPEGKF